ncbi:MAG: acyl carrier protein [Calditrichaeota bacterium]|nr:MAG: acyl carrier protein [Calditrichota bacterium]
MSEAHIEQRIREFLYEDSLKETFENLTEQDSLLELGIIDSVKMIELVSFIEQQFGIQVDEEDLIPENFDNIAAMTRYIADRLNGGADGR